MNSNYLGLWVIILVIMLFFICIIGWKVNNRLSGVLIDERNKFSLSRLQILSWTVIVLSAFATACLYNMVHGNPNPLSIAIPEELWLLMGISTTALVGSPLILNSKKTGKPDKKERDRNKGILKKKDPQEAENLTNKNTLMIKKDPKDASISDMFRGDETGNFAQVDISKIQLFYITMLLLLAYLMALGGLLASDPGSFTEFPQVDSSMVALLGISNAGYLTYKGASHSMTQEE
jgi:hypothetical protein